MDMRDFALPVLLLFLVASVFGAYVMFGPMHMSAGCPLIRGELVVCTSTIVEHINHWQLAFASVLFELLAFAGFALFAVGIWSPYTLRAYSHERIRLRSRAPVRPTLFQELFSRGILNRKEPYGVAV